MNKVFEIGVLGFGGENGVEVYILFKCYFITLNIKFIIWYRLLEMSSNYVFSICLGGGEIFILFTILVYFCHYLWSYYTF